MNGRRSRATDCAPNERLAEEAEYGGPLPSTAADYGFARPGHVSREALVAIEGNQYSVPVAHVGAPVTVRRHASRVVLWRDTEALATHERAPDGAHRRVVVPEHFAPLFGRKPRAQVMLYRQALLELGAVAVAYVREVSRRQRAHLRSEVLGLYALLGQHSADRLLAVLAQAAAANAYGVAYVQTLLAAPSSPALDQRRPELVPTLALPGVPGQADVERPLDRYEVYTRGAPATPPGPALAVRS
ncbi:MAG: hypothetical protein HY331_01365 [Chloroflexi bacterium]|nr:hypothetical protein [Chloroflexota bacterium]